jgi:DNA-binding transcriptional MerR regulator
MTDQTDTTKPEDESLADFWTRLNDAGVDMEHIREMLDRLQTERAKVNAKAARLFCGNEQDEPISLLDHADELSRMKLRAWGLLLAIEGSALPRGSERDGLIRIAQDVADGMERVESSFDAERWLARAGEKAKPGEG